MKQVSKLENRVAKLIPHMTRQHALGPYKLDFVDVAAKVALEVQGCYWHCCPVCYPNGPTCEVQARGMANDFRKLKAEGWKVIDVWEHDIKEGLDVAALVAPRRRAKPARS